MNPFDAPPSTPPVSFDPPADPPAPRRGRMVVAALAGAGLLGGGIIGVSAFASADDEPAFDQAMTELPAVDPAATSVPTTDAPAEPTGEPSDRSSDEPVLDGQITIDDGTGDPLVLDLGDLGAFQECMGLPDFLGDGSGDTTLDDLDLGDVDLGELDLGSLDLEHLDLGALLDQFFGEGGPLADLDLGDAGQLDPGRLDAMPGAGTVTVIGEDGVTVVDLGDGDGSVTISRDADTGEVTVETDGTATAQSLGDLIGPLLDELDLGDLDLNDLDLGDLDPGAPDGPDLGGLDLGGLDLGGLFDPEQLQQCLDELG